MISCAIKITILTLICEPVSDAIEALQDETFKGFVPFELS